MIYNSCIIVFIKNPVKGKVKTRLAKNISDDKALQLYKNFIHDLINKVKKTGFNFKIYAYPEETINISKKLLNYNFPIFVQKGCDLGGKMKNAFLDVFNQGFKNIIIIGSDIPEITIDILKNAIYKLNENTIVIGPSNDGGYYLIGFNKDYFLPDIFYNIEWSTNKVLENTLKIINKNNFNYYLLEKLNDIDEYNDLVNFYMKNKNLKNNNNPKTIDFLNKNKNIFTAS